MTYSRRIAPMLLAGAACLAACDDGDETPQPDPDMIVVMDMTPEPDPDMADPDMNVMDVEVDAEVIDMIVDAEIDAVIDAEIDANTIVMPGPMCEEDVDCEGEGDWLACLDEQCQLDLRPDVFVINQIQVVEPAGSAELIQSFLEDAVQRNQLNLIVEPGGYNDQNEYLWYIGNGGFRRAQNDYNYLGAYPVQNFYGFWRDDEANGLRWAPDDQVSFLLNVPTRQVENADGMTVNCISRIATTVNLTLRPERDAQGDPVVTANLSGTLLHADAAQVQFQIGEATIPLVDLLQEEDLNIDTDGDGEFDAYPFEFDAVAGPVVFAGDPPAEDGSNRDPDPAVMNDPACDD